MPQFPTTTVVTPCVNFGSMAGVSITLVSSITRASRIRTSQHFMNSSLREHRAFGGMLCVFVSDQDLVGLNYVICLVFENVTMPEIPSWVYSNYRSSRRIWFVALFNRYYVMRQTRDGLVTRICNGNEPCALRFHISWRAQPVAVSVELPGSNIWMPHMSSSSRIWRLRADCATCRRAAAAVNVPLPQSRLCS